PGVQALLLTGGSAYGLGAAEGVVAWLAERKIGYPTRAGLVPLVSAAVVFDLPLGDFAWPDAAAGRSACEEAAGGEVERGRVGAGGGPPGGDPFALAAVAGEVAAAAVRDAVRSAPGAPGCPAAAERRT